MGCRCVVEVRGERVPISACVACHRPVLPWGVALALSALEGLTFSHVP